MRLRVGANEEIVTAFSIFFSYSLQCNKKNKELAHQTNADFSKCIAFLMHFNASQKKEEISKCKVA